MRLETLCGTDIDCPAGVAVQRLVADMRLAEFAPTVRQQRHYVGVSLSPRSPVTGRRNQNKKIGEGRAQTLQWTWTSGLSCLSPSGMASQPWT